MTSWTKESIEAWERHREESRAALVEFCAAEGITVERFIEARRRAVAQKRAPGIDGLTRHVVGGDSGHARARLESFDAFLARYSPEQQESALVEMVVAMRCEAASRAWLEANGATATLADLEAHGREVEARAAEWRAELVARMEEPAGAGTWRTDRRGVLYGSDGTIAAR